METAPRLTAHGTLDPSKQSDSQTVAGLLAKRAKMFNEARRLRERMAELSNDVAALDRVLVAFGYDGDLDAIMPREKPGRMFSNGDLLRICHDEVRENGPITAREIAIKIIKRRREDPEDRKHLLAVTENVSRRLRKERSQGRLNSLQGKGNALLWESARRN